MKKTSTAVLLSALVFPGSGHVYLRHYARGIILIAICAVALFDFMRRIWQQVEMIQTQLITEINANGVIDLNTLIEHAIHTVDRIDRQPYTIATAIFAVCWLIGILDSYRIGKQLDEIPPSP